MLKIIKTNLDHNVYPRSFDIFNEIHGMSAVYQNSTVENSWHDFELSADGGTDEILSKIWNLSNEQINDEEFLDSFVEDLDSDIVDSAETLQAIRTALVENWEDVSKYYEEIVKKEMSEQEVN